jgi:hypothetical protein
MHVCTCVRIHVYTYTYTYHDACALIFLIQTHTLNTSYGTAWDSPLIIFLTHTHHLCALHMQIMIPVHVVSCSLRTAPSSSWTVSLCMHACIVHLCVCLAVDLALPCTMYLCMHVCQYVFICVQLLGPHRQITLQVSDVCIPQIIHWTAHWCACLVMFMITSFNAYDNIIQCLW